MTKLLQEQLNADKGSSAGWSSPPSSFHPKKRLIKASALTALLFLLSLSTVFASHFRYGNVTWKRISETSTTVTIRLNVSLAWRLTSAPGSANFTITNGATTTGSVNVPLSNVTDPSGGWTNSTGSTGVTNYPDVTLTKSATPYTLAFNSGNKIAGLANNDQGYWNVFTTVNTNSPGSSPVSTLPAIINMPINAGAATYTIPASDPDAGSTLSYRLATGTEMAGIYPVGVQPGGLTINPTTGQITFNTIGKTVGQLWNADVIVTDNNGNQIMLDFLINMTNASTPPAFDYAITPSNGAVYNVIAGQNITFKVKATDPDQGGSVGLSASGLPTYITTANFNPAFPATGNPSQTTFNWTPSSAQIGNTVILNFIATDNVGVQNSTSVTIKVVAEPAPVFISPTPDELSWRQIETGTILQDIISAQSSLGSNVSIAYTSGIPASATLSPAVPTAGANPGQTTLTWTPTPADFGQKTFSYQATISSTPTIFATRTYSLIVNTTPKFTSIPVLNALVGVPYTYNITVNDPDVAYGDMIDITDAALPSWLTITDNHNGTATLSGTPTMANVGLNAMHLHAEDIYHSHTGSAHVSQKFDINVELPCNTVLATTKTDVSCYGAANGSVDLQVSGGKTPFNFNWSNGATTEDLANLAPGTYTVIVTDANNCTETTNVTITQPANVTPVANNDQLTAAACQSFTFTAAQLLGNDTDPQGGQLEIADVMQPSNGTITSNANGTYTYNPAAGFSGNVTFNYTVKKDDPMIAYSGNGHFYEYVSSPDICWTTAKDQAETRSYYGMKGYLATITSAGENAFAAAKLQGNGWIGGADDVVEGEWRWKTGPEAGQQFYQGWAWGGYATGFQNWAGGEPNDYGNEDYAHFYTGSGQWNDLPNCTYGWINGYVVEYGGMENCNPILTASATVTIQVTAPAPIVVRTNNVSVALNASGNASISAAQINNGSTSGCGITNVSVSKTTFNCSNTGANTVVLTVTDNYGQVATGNAIVTVTDNIKPTISAPAAVNVFANNGSCVATNVALGNATAADNCAGVVISNNAPATFPNGTTTVTWKATDASGNFATATQSVTVKDNQAPVIAGPHNQIIDLNGTCSVTLPDYRNQLLALSDNCTPNNALIVTQSPEPGTVVNGTGNMTVSFTAKDAAGNIGTGSFTVTKRDIIAPVVAAKNFTLVLNANGQGVLNTADVNNNSSDNCSAVSLTFSNKGTVCGIVNENGVLTLSAPAGAVFTAVDFASYGNADGNCGSFTQGWCHAANSKAVVSSALLGKNSGSIAASNGIFGDPCYGTFKRLVVQATYTINGVSANGTTIAFDCSHVGNNTVTLIGTDASGNVGSKTATVTVQDNTAPIAAAQDLTVQLDASGNGSISAAMVNNGSSDACGIKTLSLDKGTFNCSNVGANTVTLTVTDNNNNVSTATATITVEDNVAPKAIARNLTVQLDASGNGSISTAMVNNGSSDACGIKSMTIDNEAFNCSNVGANTVTLTVTDNNDNVSTATATVTVEDNVAPVALAKNATVQLDATGNGSVTVADINNGSSDACGIASMTLSTMAFDCSNVGANTVTLTVTDNNGNVSTKTATVTVEDKVAPIAVAQNLTVQLDASGNGSITSAMVNNGSSDACGIKTLSLDKETFNCSNVGVNTVTLTITDNNNNVSTATATITVEDNVAPIAIAQNLTVQLDASGNGSVTVAMVNNGSSDACGIKSMTIDNGSFNCSNVGPNTVTLTVTDNNHNVSTATATITVEDNVAPVAITKNATVQLDASGNGSITVAEINNGSSDACGIASMTLSKMAFDCSNFGANTVTLTVTDNHGNVSTKTATVTVEDNVAPVAIAKNISVTLANGAASITPADVDNNSSDACGIASMTVSPNNFSCGTLGNNQVTLTVTDNHGNVSSTKATVNVIGEIPAPSITVVPTSTVYTGGNVKNLYLGYGAQSANLNAKGGVKYKWKNANGLTNANAASALFTPTTAGTFTFDVDVTNQYGCVASTSVTVNVIDARCGNKNDKVMICHNGQNICVAPSAVPAHMAHGGDYIGTCGDNTAKTTAASTLKAEEAVLKAFPNPFTTATNVEFTLAQDGKYRIEMIDMKGSLISVIAEGEGQANKYYSYEVAGDRLPTGMYIVRLVSANEVKHLKIMLEK